MLDQYETKGSALYKDSESRSRNLPQSVRGGDDLRDISILALWSNVS
jgi:hypothetical protein